MARAKSRFRKVFNARYLRWWLIGASVRICPPLGRALGFFPDHVTMLEQADDVLAEETQYIAPESLHTHMGFLERCIPHDSVAPEVNLPGGIVMGRRTAIFRNAWIDTTTSSVLLPQKARTVLVRGKIANWNAVSAKPFPRRIPLNGRVWMPLDTVNYFHVLLENGLRLIDLLDSGVLAGSALTVALRPAKTEVETALWSGIGKLYPEVVFAEVPTGAMICPDEALLHFPRDNYWEWPPVSRASAARLAEVFAATYRDRNAESHPNRLFLTRKGAKLRTPRNSNDLDRALTDAGFTPFTANDSNHPAQIDAFGAAKTIVAVHGAGLTNLVFCKPGTKVIEIFPGNFIKSTYWNLARQMGLEYTPVICGPGDYDQRFEVDIPAVLNALQPARAA
ncbi:MAG: glycosyltransferase 61 family protein [Pseudomonadota bacterium]